MPVRAEECFGAGDPTTMPPEEDVLNKKNRGKNTRTSWLPAALVACGIAVLAIGAVVLSANPGGRSSGADLGDRPYVGDDLQRVPGSRCLPPCSPPRARLRDRGDFRRFSSTSLPSLQPGVDDPLRAAGGRAAGEESGMKARSANTKTKECVLRNYFITTALVLGLMVSVVAGAYVYWSYAGEPPQTGGTEVVASQAQGSERPAPETGASGGGGTAPSRSTPCLYIALHRRVSPQTAPIWTIA